MCKIYTEEQIRRDLQLDAGHHKPLPDDHVVMVNFRKFRESDLCANNREHLIRLGVTDPATIESLLWSAYLTGFKDGYGYAKTCDDPVQQSYNRSKPLEPGFGEVPAYWYRGRAYTVVPGDCGTTDTIDSVVTPHNAHSLIGRNIVTKQGLVNLGTGNIHQYQGQTVHLRSVVYCKEPGDLFCEACAGALVLKRAL